MLSLIVDKWSRNRSPFAISFRPRSNIGRDESEDAIPRRYTRVIFLTQTVYMWSITQSSN